MPDPKRKARVTTRFRERERQLLETAAEELGLHLSELIREASLAAARRCLRGASRDLPPEVTPREVTAGG